MEWLAGIRHASTSIHKSQPYEREPLFKACNYHNLYIALLIWWGFSMLVGQMLYKFIYLYDILISLPLFIFVEKVLASSENFIYFLYLFSERRYFGWGLRS
jgi:hypothetical protein